MYTYKLNLAFIVSRLQTGRYLCENMLFNICFLLFSFFTIRILDTSWANAMNAFSKRPQSSQQEANSWEYPASLTALFFFQGIQCSQKLTWWSWNCVYPWKREKPITRQIPSAGPVLGGSMQKWVGLLSSIHKHYLVLFWGCK